MAGDKQTNEKPDDKAAASTAVESSTLADEVYQELKTLEPPPSTNGNGNGNGNGRLDALDSSLPQLDLFDNKASKSSVIEREAAGSDGTAGKPKIIEINGEKLSVEYDADGSVKALKDKDGKTILDKDKVKNLKVSNDGDISFDKNNVHVERNHDGLTTATTENGTISRYPDGHRSYTNKEDKTIAMRDSSGRTYNLENYPAAEGQESTISFGPADKKAKITGNFDIDPVKGTLAIKPGTDVTFTDINGNTTKLSAGEGEISFDPKTGVLKQITGDKNKPEEQTTKEYWGDGSSRTTSKEGEIAQLADGTKITKRNDSTFSIERKFGDHQVTVNGSYDKANHLTPESVSVDGKVVLGKGSEGGSENSSILGNQNGTFVEVPKGETGDIRVLNSKTGEVSKIDKPLSLESSFSFSKQGELLEGNNQLVLVRDQNNPNTVTEVRSRDGKTIAKVGENGVKEIEIDKDKLNDQFVVVAKTDAGGQMILPDGKTVDFQEKTEGDVTTRTFAGGNKISFDKEGNITDVNMHGNAMGDGKEWKGWTAAVKDGKLQVTVNGVPMEGATQNPKTGEITVTKGSGADQVTYTLRPDGSMMEDHPLPAGYVSKGTGSYQVYRNADGQVTEVDMPLTKRENGQNVFDTAEDGTLKKSITTFEYSKENPAEVNQINVSVSLAGRPYLAQNILSLKKNPADAAAKDGNWSVVDAQGNVKHPLSYQDSQGNPIKPQDLQLRVNDKGFVQYLERDGSWKDVRVNDILNPSERKTERGTEGSVSGRTPDYKDVYNKVRYWDLPDKKTPDGHYEHGFSSSMYGLPGFSPSARTEQVFNERGEITYDSVGDSGVRMVGTEKRDLQTGEVAARHVDFVDGPNKQVPNGVTINLRTADGNGYESIKKVKSIDCTREGQGDGQYYKTVYHTKDGDVVRYTSLDGQNGHLDPQSNAFVLDQKQPAYEAYKQHGLSEPESSELGEREVAFHNQLMQAWRQEFSTALESSQLTPAEGQDAAVAQQKLFAEFAAKIKAALQQQQQQYIKSRQGVHQKYHPAPPPPQQADEGGGCPTCSSGGGSCCGG